MINHLLKWSCVWIAGVVLASPVLAQTTQPTQPTQPTDAAVQAAVKPLVELATWCAANKAKATGDQALAAAKALVAAPAGAEVVAAPLAAATTDADESPAVVAKKTAAYKSAADVLQALSEKQGVESAQADSWLVKAIRLSPAGRNVALETAVDRAITEKRSPSLFDLYALATVFDPTYAVKLEKDLLDHGDLPAAANKAVAECLLDDQAFSGFGYLTRLTKVDPRGFAAGAYQPCTDVLAARVFMVRIPTHAMVAYVSVPWKWTPAKPSPVIFCFAGAGKEYKSICENFHNAVGDGPYVVVSPVTLTNTNSVTEAGFAGWYPRDVVHPYVSGALNVGTIAQRLQFDLPGIVALATAMHESANTKATICITGFSGGGLPCYGTMITSPTMIAAAAPACGNYYLSLIPRGRSGGVQVQQFFGEKDGFNAAIGNGAGLIAQGHEASSFLSAMGYDVADPVVVPGVGHAAMVQQVLDFFKIARMGKAPPP